jgi:hypothetical protein
MMNFKTTLVLALILVIGITGVLFLKKQDKKREDIKQKEGKLLTIDKEKIKEIFLEPSNIHIVKDSTEWKIVSPVQTDGDKSSIDAVVNMFDFAKIERTVSADPTQYASFGLNPPQGEMIIVHDKGADTLFMGDKTPTGSFVFARRSGSPEVIMTTTSLQSNIEKKLFDVRNKEVLEFDKNQIRTFTLQTPKSSFTLEKEGSNWKLAKPIAEKADDTKVNEILNRLDGERAKEFIDEDPVDLGKYGLSKPTTTVNLFLGENRAQKSLLIGMSKGNQYFAKDVTRKPVFLVDSSFVGVLKPTLFNLRNKKLADITSSDVNKIELIHSDSTITAEKDTAGNWLLTAPEQHKAKNWKFTTVASSVSSLQAKEFVTDSPGSLKPYGLDKPVVRARLFKDGNLLVDLELGAVKNDNVYARVADQKAVYLVEKSLVEKLKLKLPDIIEEPAPVPPSDSKKEK